jgi:hypothetical protein
MRTLALLALAALAGCAAPNVHRGRVALTPLVTLGTTDSSGFPAPPRVAALPGHRWLAWVPGRAGSVRIFDSTGRAIAGWSAALPAALDAVAAGAGDTVVVVGGGRIVWIDGALRPVVTAAESLGTVTSAAALSSGRVALGGVAAPGRTPSGAVVSRDGHVAATLDQGREAVAGPVLVQPGPDGGAWTMGTRGRLQLDRWDSGGRWATVIPLRRNWFRSVGGTEPVLAGFWLDGADHLWLAGSGPDTAGVVGHLEMSQLDSGFVMADTTFTPAVAQVVESGVVSVVRQDGAGRWVAELYRAELDDPGRKGATVRP